MKDLIRGSINWDALGGQKSEYRFELGKAVIHKDTGVLDMPVRLNFVMPFLDYEKIKAIIIHKLDLITDVNFIFEYENPVLEDETLAKLFLPYMIEEVNGEYVSITKMIDEKEVKIEDRMVTYYALGDFAAQQLNDRLARKFSEILRERLGLHFEVRFENNTQRFEEMHKFFRENEGREIEQTAREYREEVRARAAAVQKKSEKSAGGGFQPKGGFSAKGGEGGRKRKEKELPASGNRIMGRDISGGKTVELRDIDPKMGTVVVEGILFKISERLIKNGNHLVSLLITDNKTTVCTKAFVTEAKWGEINDLLKPGDAVKIRGEVQWDTFENMNTIMFKDLEKADREIGREDTWEDGKRVELHIHSKMSQMDGFNEAKDIVAQAAKWGQPAVAVTDHGVVQAFPDCAAEAKKQAEKGRPIKVIYGVEGYVFDDADCIDENGEIDYKTKPTNHIIILAKSQEGLKNIYKLVSYSHINYFYKKPRLPWSVIEAHREGLIIGSACSYGEVFLSMVKRISYNKRTHTRHITEQASPEEQERIASRYDYLEIQPVINNRFMLEEAL